jgi:predicted HicB family RNase H-like nuclease
MPDIETRSVMLRVRIRPSLKRALDRLAALERRTLSAWLERLLEQAVEQEQTKSKRK